MGDPIRTTGVFNEFRLENIVRSHVYNQDLCNKIYDETFANMFSKLRDNKYGTEYWAAQHAKMHNALASSLKGPTTKMYLNEFHRVNICVCVCVVFFFFMIHYIFQQCVNIYNNRAKRDTTVMQAFRGLYDELQEIRSLIHTDSAKRPSNQNETTPAPPKESTETATSNTYASKKKKKKKKLSSAVQVAVNKFTELLQQMEETIENRRSQLEQTKSEVGSLLLEDMQVNGLMEYVTQLRQSKTKYVQTIDDLQSKITAARRAIDCFVVYFYVYVIIYTLINMYICPKSKSTGENKWNELTEHIKGLEIEEQNVMKVLQNNISLATKLMSVINCYKDFCTLCKMFEREIEKKNEEYNSLRDVLNDKDSYNDKGLLANVKSKKAEILQFVDQNLAKTNKESHLNRISFILKRFEGCMQSRNEVDTEQNVDQWYHCKKEEMQTKETELRQELGHLATCLTTFDMLIGELEKALSAKVLFFFFFFCKKGNKKKICDAKNILRIVEHFKKDYIYVCLEGSQTYQLKYLCVSYESQKYQIFNDIGEEQLNKRPLFEGKCTSRFLSKMEAKVNTQTEKGTGFIFDEHRFFCSDFFEYRCWKSYVLTGVLFFFLCFNYFMNYSK
ncbi:viral A-type inclusion protein [Reticulomyxa filosa]|uniref:Viral A-type inclusion protein n=1 Tax=Reticulomyxa filosa TaxID=46433 RepID=X6MPK6_RETFI|nr:viral A-type inclusion protein [Reticulomyxa filosa]|eukprot:ETO15908.1 viral A-type inclusion protein [Reticulomyxa filosa]